MFYPHLGLTNFFVSAGLGLEFSEKLQTALLNIVLGMGIVFIVLLFMSFLIFIIKFIPRLFHGGDYNKTPDEKKTFTEASDAISAKEDLTNDSWSVHGEENLMADTELVAVITAAIMTYMGDEVPEDGLVVRSIKRSKHSGWQRTDN
jgi:sodium pump decarboxylase gamma subunit